MELCLRRRVGTDKSSLSWELGWALVFYLDFNNTDPKSFLRKYICRFLNTSPWTPRATLTPEMGGLCKGTP